MAKSEVIEEFEKLGGKLIGGDPVIDSPVFYTVKGTPYLKAPGVGLLSKPQVNLEVARGFLAGFGDELGFDKYLDDPVKLPDPEALTKFAGQLCYASFGEKRTWNEKAQRYFLNLIESGHGSVLEHVNFSYLWYGMSRTASHEVVRHRAGAAWSQLSQRYVSGRVLRYVERPEYQGNKKLHSQFERRIDRTTIWYNSIARALLGLQKTGNRIMSAEAKTDLRKKVQQASRSALPGETETTMVATGNVRALRHIANMRASAHAEIEIRELAYRSFLCLAIVAPMLVDDFKIVGLSDGTKAVQTAYPKV